MADQNIFFEQGGPLTGDSGEREGTDGIASVKPILDGESAKNATMARSTDNMRKRTEVLRTKGEDSLYLQDSNMSWIIGPGNAAGVATGAPLPVVVNWDPTGGVGAEGEFEVTEPLVLQPLNTPATDMQETIIYAFDDGVNTGDISFSASGTKRAYNGANLIRIVWVEADTGDIGGAGAPGWADAELTGDPEHIVTITIRDDGLTQIANVLAALSVISGDLTTAGIAYTNTGTTATTIDYSTEFPVTNPADYFMSGTMERELHYILPTVFTDFFATRSLADGDTLAVQFAQLVDEDPGVDGRRQRIAANANTTVLDGEIFNTSEYPDRIPMAIPLCKRLGDVLYWIDGTIVTPAASAGGVPFGGFLGPAVTGSPDSLAGPASLITQIADLLVLINARARLAEDENVTGDWIFASSVEFKDDVEVGTGVDFILLESLLYLEETNIEMYEGDFDLYEGNLTLGLGDLELEEGNVHMEEGDFTMSDGDITVTIGNFTLMSGNATVTDGSLHVYADADDIDLSTTSGTVNLSGNVAMDDDLSTFQCDAWATFEEDVTFNDDVLALNGVLEGSELDVLYASVEFEMDVGGTNIGGEDKYITVPMYSAVPRWDTANSQPKWESVSYATWISHINDGDLELSIDGLLPPNAYLKRIDVMGYTDTAVVGSDTGGYQLLKVVDETLLDIWPAIGRAYFPKSAVPVEVSLTINEYIDPEVHYYIMVHANPEASIAGREDKICGAKLFYNDPA